MGEYLDSLRAFGIGFEDPAIRKGFEFLLSVQNHDGSWGDVHDPDIYGRYHPTWTSVDGLRDYRWSKTAPCPVK
jgi:squalene cyclase